MEYNGLPWKFTAGTPNILGTILSAQAIRLLIDFSLWPGKYKYFMTGKISTGNFLGFSTFAPTFFGIFNFRPENFWDFKISSRIFFRPGTFNPKNLATGILARACRARSVVREFWPVHVLRCPSGKNRVFFRILLRSFGKFLDARTFEPEKIRELGENGELIAIAGTKCTV